MTSQQLNPSPKDKFQKNESFVKEHHDLLANPAFDRAEDVAMLSFSRSLAKDLEDAGPNAQLVAVQNGIKLLGVQQFIAHFRMLAEKPLTIEKPGLSRTLSNEN